MALRAARGPPPASGCARLQVGRADSSAAAGLLDRAGEVAFVAPRARRARSAPPARAEAARWPGRWRATGGSERRSPRTWSSHHRHQPRRTRYISHRTQPARGRRPTIAIAGIVGAQAHVTIRVVGARPGQRRHHQSNAERDQVHRAARMRWSRRGERPSETDASAPPPRADANLPAPGNTAPSPGAPHPHGVAHEDPRSAARRAGRAPLARRHPTLGAPRGPWVVKEPALEEGRRSRAARRIRRRRERVRFEGQTSMCRSFICTSLDQWL